jgi:hypothetical protein
VRVHAIGARFGGGWQVNHGCCSGKGKFRAPGSVATTILLAQCRLANGIKKGGR